MSAADPDDVRATFERAGLIIYSPTEVALIEREQREAVAEQERQTRRAARVKLWEGICPKRYREPFDFARVAADVDPAELRRVLDWVFSDRGLYVTGATGHSKSRAVGNALTRIFIEEGRSVRFLDGVEFANSAGAAFCSADTSERWLRELCKPDVLWIDDLAKRWTPATEEAAFAVVERRTSRCLPVVITNNYDRADMLAMAHDALVMGPMLRRLKDYSDVVDL